MRVTAQVLAAAGTGLDDFFQSRGLCPDSLFGEVMLDPRALETPTATIGLNQYCILLEQAAQRSRDPNLGLDYGQQFKPDMLGLIGYIALSSETLLDAAANLARYFGYHQQQTVTTLVYNEPFWHLTYRIVSDRIVDRTQDALVTMGMFCNVFRACAGDGWAPDAVHLEHRRGENWRDIETCFDAPVSFGQPVNAILFRPERATMRMPTADARLLALLSSNITALGLHNPSESMIDRISATIRDNLGTEQIDLQTVSRKLSVPTWTLRRRLAEENTSFSDVVDRVRREVAERYLARQDLQIGQLSELLGYAEISAFTRAFKRWHDISPAQYRKQRLDLTHRETRHPNGNAHRPR
jgi:AraC-like DNA-binding protein